MCARVILNDGVCYVMVRCCPWCLVSPVNRQKYGQPSYLYLWANCCGSVTRVLKYSVHLLTSRVGSSYPLLYCTQEALSKIVTYGTPTAFECELACTQLRQ